MIEVVRIRESAHIAPEGNKIHASQKAWRYITALLWNQCLSCWDLFETEKVCQWPTKGITKSRRPNINPGQGEIFRVSMSLENEVRRNQN